MKRNGGFTLMELLIVIAIIMILAGAIVARVSTGGERARIGKATAELEELATACRGFYADTGAWPNAMITSLLGPLAANVTGYDIYGDALSATSTPKLADVISLWKGPYLEKEVLTTAPLDPWGNAYAFEKDTGTPPNLFVKSTNTGVKRVLVHKFETAP